jgi:hypothetical protein
MFNFFGYAQFSERLATRGPKALVSIRIKLLALYE